ncbi:hypothetical protein MGA3_12700 [Bacillus methanolicus MGA3]|nr:hypothetical protein MGA3_12700 [Bacillus methanolicus MGA3]
MPIYKRKIVILFIDGIKENEKSASGRFFICS